MRQIWLGLILFLPAAAWGQTAPVPQGEPPAPGIHVPDMHFDQLRPPRTQTPGTTPQAPDANPGLALPKRQASALPAPKVQETDDQLLGKLAKAADKQAAQTIEHELEARWSHSGSPSADLLLKHADQALQAEDNDTARDIAKKLTVVAPDFAEGWHRRAMLATQADDYQDALNSLRHTLALQPKHFVALAELGEILEEFNDKPHALEAYRKAKALDPFIEGVDDRIRDLAKAVEGQGI